MKINESEHSNQALNREDVAKVSKDQTQNSVANHDDLYSNGDMYSWENLCKLNDHSTHGVLDH